MNSINRLKIDPEYATSHSREVAWLIECGVPYVHVKVVDGITIWKFKKTEALGTALAQFWKR